jgi:hypothetical protein
MSDLTDIAAAILEDQGEPVDYTAGESDPEIVPAVVTRYGRGYCPTGWPADTFRNQATHAQFRLSPNDVPNQPQVDDILSVDALDYRVRKVSREPKTGPSIMWWICLCAAEQGGKY